MYIYIYFNSARKNSSCMRRGCWWPLLESPYRRVGNPPRTAFGAAIGFVPNFETPRQISFKLREPMTTELCSTTERGSLCLEARSARAADSIHTDTQTQHSGKCCKGSNGKCFHLARLVFASLWPRDIPSFSSRNLQHSKSSPRDR